MCGRYYVDEGLKEELREEFQELAENLVEGLAAGAGGDVCPGQEALVLTLGQRGLAPAVMKWGFPRKEGKGLLINARAETVFTKRYFQEGIREGRCVIPARRFYEWNPSREKAAFFRRDSSALYLAGVFQPFSAERRFLILTTRANPSVVPVHSRMPLLLEKEEVWDWIFSSDKTEALLKKTPCLLEREQEYQQEVLPFL